jgi:murein DD-endopeptidase MepM/ murein hydrolase activator NlpD
MKFKRLSKSLTLMIIPEANRNIVRFKLPTAGLYALPVCMSLVVMGSGLAVYGSNAAHKRSEAILQQEHLGEEQKLADKIQTQDAELDKLNAELSELSELTERFKSRLEQIKELEASIQQLAPVSVAPSPSPERPAGNMGGPPLPAAPEQTIELAQAAKSEMSRMSVEVEGLLLQLETSKTKLIEAEQIRSSTPSVWPVGTRTVTSGFGVRKDPFTFTLKFHSGLDIAGKAGDPVFATANGTVSSAGWDKDYGNCILVDHGRGISTRYGHLSRINVSKGQQVTKGQTIGQVGSTGRSTGNHLHYEVLKGNVVIDPVPYLKAKTS